MMSLGKWWNQLQTYFAEASFGAPGTSVGLAPPSTWHLFKRLNAFSSNKISASATTLRRTLQWNSGNTPRKTKMTKGNNPTIARYISYQKRVMFHGCHVYLGLLEGLYNIRSSGFCRGTPNNLLCTLLVEVAVAWNATEKFVFSLWIIWMGIRWPMRGLMWVLNSWYACKISKVYSITFSGSYESYVPMFHCWYIVIPPWILHPWYY